jgi:hypothetical protein
MIGGVSSMDGGKGDEERMSPKRRFLAGILGGRVDRPPVGNPTSIATVELQRQTEAFFPDAHLDAEARHGVQPLIGAGKGRSRVIVSHDREAATAGADLVLELR